MRQDKTYQISYSVSKQQCVNKDAAYCIIASKRDNPNIVSDRIKYFGNEEGMLFQNTNSDIDTLTERLITGHTIAPNFKLWFPKSIKTGWFTMSEKTNKNFEGSNFLAIDVDESSIPLPDFLGILWNNNFLPSTAYTTYSNNKTPGLYKYRAIFVLDTIIKDFLSFRFYSWKLIEHIENLTGVKVDSCCLVASQYYNGCWMWDQGIQNPEVIDPYVMPKEYRGNIFSLFDIPGAISIQEQEFINFLGNGAGWCKDTATKYKQQLSEAILRLQNGFFNFDNLDLPFFDEEETRDWQKKHYEQDFAFGWWLKKKSIKECITRFQVNYPFFYRNCCVDGYDGWNKKFGDVPRIPSFEGYWRIKDPTNGKDKLKKGNHRPSALRQFLTECRLMFPGISYPYLFTQGLIFLENKIDNSDNKITIKSLMKTVNNVMRLEYEEFEEIYGGIRDTRIEFAKKHNGKWIYRSGEDYRNFAITETKTILQNNPGLTPQQQLIKIQQERGVSQRQAYRNLKKSSVDVKQVDEIMKIVDPEKSLNWNVNEIRSKGFKGRKSKIKKIIEDKKKLLNP